MPEFDFLDKTFYGNSVQSWLLALLVAVVSVLVLRVLIGFVVRRALSFSRRTSTDLDDLVAHLLEKTGFLFVLILSVFVGSLVLVLPDKVTRWTRSLIVLVLLVQAGIWLNAFISYSVQRYKRERADEDPGSATVITALGFVGQLVLWTAVLLLALDNLGVNITTMIAGLGVTGIAVGLALQDILGDLFASLSIVLDKPFEIGDLIVVGEYKGTVEHIGLKTTRVRSLSGEQLVFSNNDLTQGRIQNFKRMEERRVAFSIGVVYETAYEKLAAVPGIVQEIIEGRDPVRFDRAHFKDYGDFSLNFEIVYFVLSSDYNLYMDVQQAINLALFRRFEEEGIVFAYPTQMLYVSRDTTAEPALS